MKKHTHRSTSQTHGLSASTAVLLVAFVASGSWAVRASAPRFFADDPIAVEPDSQDASRVQSWTIDLGYDLVLNLFGHPGDRTTGLRAQNVNTIDEVPDGSWFTNRLGRKTLSAEEVGRGPNTGDGPADGQWTVTAAKSDGVTPGFTIRDAKGALWFLKFDPSGYRGMATGTEVVVTKLVWALGYHVPENYIGRLVRDRLAMGEGARYAPPGRTRRDMHLDDIDDLLKRAQKDDDGTYRIIASRALEGKPLGGFRYYGTRPDDPNDVVRHEHRRELRGLSVFAAWLNHVDVKSGNSLDTLIEEGGRAHVKHHLLDFGSTLGSAAVYPRPYSEGYEYMAEPRAIGKRMFAFGFVVPKWRTIEFTEVNAIGRLPADNTKWDPESWKPRVPNAAFLRARADDRFWAAVRLAQMKDEFITAAVRSGQFDDETAEQTLTRALIDRRDAILRAYLPAINPVVDLRMADGTLRFRNAAVEAGVAPAPKGYRAVWHRFDNATGETSDIGETTSETAELRAPANLPDGDRPMVRVDVAATGSARTEWERPVHAYFRRANGSWTLVGLYRMGVEDAAPAKGPAASQSRR